MNTGEFVQVWRVGWRDLRQQHDVLALLYEQLVRNATDRPDLPIGDVETAHGLSEHLQWVETLGTSLGARDAYATAVVMFVDDLLKRVYGAYKVAGGPEPLTLGLRGVPLHRLFKAAGNNVRHYQDWNRDWTLEPPGSFNQMEREIKILAQALDHPQPVQVQHYCGYAVNMAWIVLLTISMTYEKFEEWIQAALMEMVDGLGVNDAWIQHELSQGTYGTSMPPGSSSASSSNGNT